MFDEFKDADKITSIDRQSFAIRTEYIVRPSLEQEKPRLKSIDFSFKTGWKINISSKCRVSVCTTVEL